VQTYHVRKLLKFYVFFQINLSGSRQSEPTQQNQFVTLEVLTRSSQFTIQIKSLKHMLSRYFGTATHSTLVFKLNTGQKGH